MTYFKNVATSQYSGLSHIVKVIFHDIKIMSQHIFRLEKSIIYRDKNLKCRNIVVLWLALHDKTSFVVT